MMQSTEDRMCNDDEAGSNSTMLRVSRTNQSHRERGPVIDEP
jgi:hypothetical protein